MKPKTQVNIKEFFKSALDRSKAIPSDSEERRNWAQTLIEDEKTVNSIPKDTQKSVISALDTKLTNSPSLNQMYEFIHTSTNGENPEQLNDLSKAKEDFLHSVALFKKNVCPETAETCVNKQQRYENILNSMTNAKREDLKKTPQGLFLLFQFNKEKEEQQITVELAKLNNEQTQSEPRLQAVKVEKEKLEGRWTRAGIFEEMVKTEISYKGHLAKCKKCLQEIQPQTPELSDFQNDIHSLENSSQKMLDVLMSLDGNPKKLQVYISGEDFKTYMASYKKFTNEFNANQKKFNLKKDLGSFMAIIQRAPQYELLLTTLHKASTKAQVPENELSTITTVIQSLKQSLQEANTQPGK